MIHLRVQFERGGASLPRLFPSHITEDMLRLLFRPASEISRFNPEEFLFVIRVLKCENNRICWGFASYPLISRIYYNKHMEYQNILAFTTRHEFRKWLEENSSVESECYLFLTRGKPVLLCAFRLFSHPYGYFRFIV